MPGIVEVVLRENCVEHLPSFRVGVSKLQPMGRILPTSWFSEGLWENSQFVYVLSMAAFVLQQQSSSCNKDCITHKP